MLNLELPSRQRGVGAEPRPPEFLETSDTPGPAVRSDSPAGFRSAMLPTGGLAASTAVNLPTAPSAANFAVGALGALSDKYTVGEELGRGAFGQVFKGRDTRSGEAVAIKQLSLGGIPGEALTGIVGEIDLLKGLDHPNIVKYIGSFKTRTHLYIIMEFMEEGALSGIIKPNRFGLFPEPMVAMYIIQVLAGLVYLHGQGVVHRDIKGANILTTREGLVKLADFGVASRLSEIATEDDPMAIAVVGTPYWMAPEVIELAPVGSAADIWSVGCLALELLTGAPPYFDLQPVSALFRIVRDPVPPLPDSLSLQMRDFLLLCFQKDPAKRPDAQAMRSHPWLATSRQQLKSSWQATLKGGRPTAVMEPVSAVVDATLRGSSPRSRSSSSGGGGLGTPTRSSTAARSRGSPGSTLRGSASAELLDEPQNSSPGSPAVEQVSLQHVRAASTGGLRTLSKSSLTLPLLPAFESSAVVPPEPQPGVEAMMAGLGVAPVDEWPGGSMAEWLGCLDAAPGTQPLAAARHGHFPSDSVRHRNSEVQQLVAALRPVGSRAAGREPPMGATLGTLAAAVAARDGRAAFFKAEGPSALLELLDGRSSEVHLGALMVVNAVAADTRGAAALAVAGLIPAVARFSDPRWPDHSVRVEAGRFLCGLASGPPPLVQLLVACQGLTSLVQLVDDAAPDKGQLAGRACNALWAALQAGGPRAMVMRCRAVAASGLPLRLVRLLALLLPDLLHVGSPDLQRFGNDNKGPIFPQLTGSQRSMVGLLSDAPLSTATSVDGHSVHRSNGSTDSDSSPLRHLNGVSGEAWSSSPAAPTTAAAIVGRAADLVLVLAHSDTVTKGYIAKRECLVQLIEVAALLPPLAALQLMRAVRTLTADPPLLLPLYECGLIQSLEPFLDAACGVAIVGQALEALSHMCTASRTRQEAAAVSGVVPHLIRLASPLEGPPAPGTPEACMRAVAVPMLCAMVHSNVRGRAALHAADGASVFLRLLPDPLYTAVALDSLATWLTEDLRLQPKLAHRDTLTRITALLAMHSPARGGDTEGLVAILAPLAKMLRAGPLVAVEAGRTALPPLLMELLKRPPAMAALPLLQALRAIYEHHPRPKEFLVKYPVQEQLRRLVADGSDASEAVLVRSQAHSLLDAFRVNTVF